MTAYYNEIDPYAAQWLRNLISAGHIAPGDVDERSIEDVKSTELMGYTQCHFFAGIGIWSLALRNAGWPDSRPVWTGSCPCQPFSAAGKGAGFDDERHLWPSWYWLIEQCQPADIFGEQVASKAVEPWIDLVQADLEAMGYAFGCVPFPSAGVGAPHIRDRAYWVGHSQREGLEGHAGNGGAAGRQGSDRPVAEAGISCGVANTNINGRNQGRKCKSSSGDDGFIGNGAVVGMANTTNQRCEWRWPGEASDGSNETRQQPERLCATDENGRPGPTNGFWSDPDWLYCRDAKWRPAQSGTFPLVNGASQRVGRLRAYGNAINAKAAEEFIRSTL